MTWRGLELGLTLAGPRRLPHTAIRLCGEAPAPARAAPASALDRAGASPRFAAMPFMARWGTAARKSLDWKRPHVRTLSGVAYDLPRFETNSLALTGTIHFHARRSQGG